jgi:BirA family biotin operon repressor/biotin-[acetyl-CoA-carboxylase] ligase
MKRFVENPFNAPVFHRETVSSTMDEARTLAARDAVHGTVVFADYQEAGRGRTAGRSWQADRGRNLFCTILLRYPDFVSIPRALTLRAGLAVSLAVEDFAPALTGSVLVKWPNDVMIGGKKASCRKAAGILTESDGKTVYIGIGVNVGQSEFPESLRSRATSIALALHDGAFSADAPCDADAPLLLLEKILARLYRELDADDWRSRLEARLYRKGEQVCFIEGAADSGKEVTGRLTGIGDSGELLIDGRAFVNGELRMC